MAAYITAEYVRAQMGAELRDHLWPDTADLTAAIGVASARVQSMVRMHCRDGSAELGETTTDENVQHATYWALLKIGGSLPGKGFELPEESLYRDVYNDFRAGKLHVSVEADPNIAEATSWSDPTDYVQRTSRDELSGL